MWCKARRVQLFYQTHIPSFLSILAILVLTAVLVLSLDLAKHQNNKFEILFQFESETFQ